MMYAEVSQSRLVVSLLTYLHRVALSISICKQKTSTCLNQTSQKSKFIFFLYLKARVKCVKRVKSVVSVKVCIITILSSAVRPHFAQSQRPVIFFIYNMMDSIKLLVFRLNCLQIRTKKTVFTKVCDSFEDSWALFLMYMYVRIFKNDLDAFGDTSCFQCDLVRRTDIFV